MWFPEKLLSVIVYSWLKLYDRATAGVEMYKFVIRSFKGAFMALFAQS